MSTPLMRVCAEKGTKVAPSEREIALAQLEALLGEHHDAAPLRRLIRERGELGRVGELLFAHAGGGHEARRPGDCRA